MEITFELTAHICVAIAVAILLWNLIHKTEKRESFVPMIFATAGIGLLTVAVAAGICGAHASAIIGTLVFFLFYTGFLLIFPAEKRRMMTNE